MIEIFENLHSLRALLECLRKKLTSITTDLGAQACSCLSHINPKLEQCTTIITELQHITRYIKLAVHKHQEQISQLKQENETLRLQENENQKITHLLTANAMTENDLVSLINKDSIDENYEKEVQDYSYVGDTQKLEGYVGNTQKLEGTLDDRKQVESLLSDLTDQKKFYLEQLQMLYNEREVTVKQKLAERKQLKHEVCKLKKELKQTYKKLNEATSELSTLKLKKTAEESFWLTEKDSIQSSLEHCKKMLQHICSLLSSYSTSQSGQDSVIENALNERLNQAENLLATYQEQMQHLEQTVAKYQEMVSENKFKFKREMLAGQLAHLKKKYKALYKRRLLEMEGFQNDISMLRKRLDALKTLLHRYISLSLQTTAGSDTAYQAYLSEQEIKTLKSEVKTTEHLIQSGSAHF